MRARHVYPDGMRATCHYEVCGTCSKEEGSLQLRVFSNTGFGCVGLLEIL